MTRRTAAGSRAASCEQQTPQKPAASTARSAASSRHARAIVSISRAGSRCAPGAATTSRAPTSSGQKNSQHRDVEAERRLLQHHVVGRQPIGVLHPGQTVVQTLMGVGRSLRAYRSSPRCRSWWPDDRGCRVIERRRRAAMDDETIAAASAQSRSSRMPVSGAPSGQPARCADRALHQHHAQSRIRHHVGDALAPDTPDRAAGRRRRP